MIPTLRDALTQPIICRGHYLWLNAPLYKSATVTTWSSKWGYKHTYRVNNVGLTALEAKDQYFNLMVSIHRDGVQSIHHKTFVIVLELWACSIHVYKRWCAAHTLSGKHVWVDCYYTKCLTKSHTGSIWLKPMESTCLCNFKGELKHITEYKPILSL